MSSVPTIPIDVANDVITRAEAAGNAVYTSTLKSGGDPRQAQAAQARTISAHLSVGGVLKTGIDVGFGLVSYTLSLFFKSISAFRHEETHTFDDTIVEVVNEFLGTELDASVMKAGQGGDETIRKANAIGKAILDRLEQEFTGGGPVTMSSGAQGARTFAGYGVNFAIQNALISIIGACIPETRLDDLRELGVEVAQNLGLGRLIRTALKPLVDNTIAKPYARQLQRKYQMDLLGEMELARAWHSGRMSPDVALEYLKQKGLSDDQVQELIDQTQLRLHAEEWNVLTAIGAAPDDSEQLDDNARGMPDELVAARQKVLTWKRTNHARDRVLTAVLSEVSNGFLQPSDLDTAMAKIGIPDDEQALWRVAAGYLYERTRKRMSQADMLFLFEAAQINQTDVFNWAKAEGYSDQDTQNLVLLFELKATEAANKTTGGAAALAVHLHKEHTAFITDLITGLWGRAPSTAELDFWVQKLDTKERTKADVKAELKALPSTGPAIPT